MKRSIVTIILLLHCLPAVSDAGERIVTGTTENGRTVEITITPGSHWKHRLMKILGLFPVNTTPQIAIWAENAVDDMKDTIYVTEKYARDKWRKTPGEQTPETGITRPEALPIWTHRMFGESTIPEEGRTRLLEDALTSASPKYKTTIVSRTRIAEDSLVVYVEINSSADFNASYPRDALKCETGYSGGRFGSGQPSLIYRACIGDDTVNPVEAVLCGHGSPDGSDGSIHPDCSGITDAVSIVESITVAVK